MFLNPLQKAMTRSPNQIHCESGCNVTNCSNKTKSKKYQKMYHDTKIPALQSIVFPVCKSCYTILRDLARGVEKQANQQPAAPIDPSREESIIAIASELVPETSAPATIDKEHCGRRHTRSKAYRASVTRSDIAHLTTNVKYDLFRATLRSKAVRGTRNMGHWPRAGNSFIFRAPRIVIRHRQYISQHHRQYIGGDE